MDNKLMWPLLAIGGLCSPAAYPLMVSLARHSHGPNLGTRMGLIVGGMWFLATFALWAAGPIAERIGTVAVMRVMPIFYLIAAAIGVYILIKYKHK